MDEKTLQNLLHDYARRQPEDRAFTDGERAQIREDLHQIIESEAPAGDPVARWRLRRPLLFAYGAIATAAMISLVFLMPAKQSPDLRMEVTVGRSLERTSLTEKRFEVTVTTKRPFWIQLVVLDESGTLKVLRTDGNSGRRIDGTGSLGSYKLSVPLPDGDLSRRTHVIVVASEKPIAIVRLAETVPDQLRVSTKGSVTSALDRLCGKLARSQADACMFMPIPTR